MSLLDAAQVERAWTLLEEPPPKQGETPAQTVERLQRVAESIEKILSRDGNDGDDEQDAEEEEEDAAGGDMLRDEEEDDDVSSNKSDLSDSDGAAASTTSTPLALSPDDVYVHWSTSPTIDISRKTGALFTYKGIAGAYEALTQSWDKDKWSKGYPNLFLFDFSKIDFLSKKYRRNFFQGGSAFKEEKDVEAAIGNMARKAGKQGWSAKYGVMNFAEYVVFNEYITEDMMITDKASVIKTFIRNSAAEIERIETNLQRDVDVNTWLTIWKQNGHNPERERLPHKRHDEVMNLFDRAALLTGAVRVLSALVNLPEDRYDIFQKYTDYRRAQVYINFKKFGTVFLQPTLNP